MSAEPHDELAFLTEIPAAETTQEVCQLCTRFANRLGKPNFSIEGMVQPGHPLSPRFHYHNWPQSWLERSESENLHSINPIPRIVAVSARPVTLTDYRAGRTGVAHDPESERLFEAAAALGRSHFLIVPIHGPIGPRGVAIFSGPGPDADLRTRGILSLLGHVAFTRLAEIETYHPEFTLNLSRAERGVLEGLARGLKDSQIAEEAGITLRTVRFHLQNARSKLGARTRAEALANAMRAGVLGDDPALKP